MEKLRKIIYALAKQFPILARIIRARLGISPPQAVDQVITITLHNGAVKSVEVTDG